MDNCTWLHICRWYVYFVWLFWLLFSLTESLLMRYHVVSYNWKPLMCKSKTYETEMDNCTWLYSYTWYVNFLLFTLFTLLFLLLFLLTESLLMRYHLISCNRKPLICQLILTNYIIIRAINRCATYGKHSVHHKWEPIHLRNQHNGKTNS